MKVKFKTAFSLIDGRLSTKIDDLYMMLNYIFSENLYTHQLLPAIKKLNEINPRWLSEGREKLNHIKKVNNTNDFNDLIEIIDVFFSEYEIEISKISGEEIKFTAGLFPDDTPKQPK